MAAENDEDLYITEIRTPVEASFYDPGSALRNAYRFLKNLPKVDIRELPANERDCEICLEAYGTNELDRKAVKLPPCGHRFGFDCIYEWLTPTNIPNRNTCPKCRVILFEMDHSGYSDDEMDDTDAGRTPGDIVMPELRALLGLRRFESFIAALDSFERFTRGDLHMPTCFSYTRQIYAIFRAFPQASIADENPPAEAVIHDTATRLAALMGSLHVRYGTMTESFQDRVPWREAGPRVDDLLDEDMHGLIKVGICYYMGFEDRLTHRPT